MDIPRQPVQSRFRVLALGGGALALLLALLGLARLKPAAPEVDRASLLLDTVQEGPMVFEVRGSGSLQPVEVRWITAAVPGRVERVRLLPGSEVKADDILLELANPQLVQEAEDARWQLRAAEADLVSARARLETGLLDLRAAMANARTGQGNARLALEAAETLAREGLVSRQELARARSLHEEQDTRLDIEQRRHAIGSQAQKAQLAPFEARVAQARALARLKEFQVAGLRVRAGIQGVLQQLPVQPGQQLQAGAVLAKVADPLGLKAELKVSEMQAKDLVPGQSVRIDTRNGLVPGRVVRVDPAVQNGTVTVDASLEGTLPKGARPDLSVEGIIEIDRVARARFVGRPVQAQSQSSVTVFRLGPEGMEATRVKVRFGRGSVSRLEILEGLQPGDRILLSDTAPYDGVDRLRIR